MSPTEIMGERGDGSGEAVGIGEGLGSTEGMALGVGLGWIVDGFVTTG